jgi:transposase
VRLLLEEDRTLAPAGVLDAHMRQPTTEKRFGHLKGVLEIAPALLKNEDRIEILFLIFFLALLVEALIEREYRRAMLQRDISGLPLYPEERTTSRPTAAQILRLSSFTQRRLITHHNDILHAYEPELTPRQQQGLGLLGIAESRYRPNA